MQKQITQFVNGELKSIEEDVKRWLLDQEWEFAVDGLTENIECDEIQKIIIENFALSMDTIKQIDEAEGYAVVSFSGMAEVEICFAYIDRSCETYDKATEVLLGTVYGNGVVRTKAPFNLTANILLPEGSDGQFDYDQPEFELLDQRNVEIIERELTEDANNIRSPYYNICPDCGQKIGSHNESGTGFCSGCGSRH